MLKYRDSAPFRPFPFNEGLALAVSTPTMHHVNLSIYRGYLNYRSQNNQGKHSYLKYSLFAIVKRPKFDEYTISL